MLNAAVPGRRRAGRLLFGALLAGSAGLAPAQDRTRLDQDELTSFYGRANVVLGSGARALGMGGAFLARADDATASSWNPAGLSYLRRIEGSIVGVSNRFSQDVSGFAVAENGSVVPVSGLDTLRATLGDFASVAYPFRWKDRLGAVQLSYQRVFTFSGDRTFNGFPIPENPSVRTDRFTLTANGGFDTISVASGLQLHRSLRVGASLNRWFNGFDQEIQRFPRNQKVTRAIGSQWRISGANVNLGLIATPVEGLNVGFVYKTPMVGTIDLNKHREDRITADDGTVQADTNVAYGGDLPIRLPSVWGVGASLAATNQLTFSLDVTATGWSRASITDFYTLSEGEGGEDVIVNPGTPQERIEFRKNGLDIPPVVFHNPLPFPAVQALRQVDSHQFRMGVEWLWTPERDPGSRPLVVPLRAGFFVDGQPVLQKGTERVKFRAFTLGAGIDIGDFLLDFAYVRETGKVDIDVDLSSRNVRYSRFLTSLIFRFGERR